MDEWHPPFLGNRSHARETFAPHRQTSNSLSQPSRSTSSSSKATSQSYPTYLAFALLRQLIMADAGNHKLRQTRAQETIPDFTPLVLRIFTSRFLQGHVCRPRPEVLRQGVETLEVNEVPSRIRQKGAPLLQLVGQLKYLMGCRDRIGRHAQGQLDRHPSMGNQESHRARRL